MVNYCDSQTCKLVLTNLYLVLVIKNINIYPTNLLWLQAWIFLSINKFTHIGKIKRLLDSKSHKKKMYYSCLKNFTKELYETHTYYCTMYYILYNLINGKV